MRALLLLLGFPLIAFAQDPPHLAAAKRRQVDTIETKVTMTKGTLTRELELHFDAPKYRVENRDSKSDSRSAYASDGVDQFQFTEHSGYTPRVNIDPELGGYSWMYDDFSALIWLYRSVDNKSLRMTELKEVGLSEFIGGVSCAIYENPLDKQRGRFRVWLDTQRDYRPCKIESLNEKEALWSELVIEYGAGDRVSGWVKRIPGTKSVETKTTKVQYLKLGHAIPDRIFELRFPKGSQVYDGRRPEFRSMLLAEDGTPLEALKPSPPSEAPDWQQPLFSALKGLGAFALLFALIAGVFVFRSAIRKRRQKQASLSNPE